ncbi:MAG: M56 family metallopeptidase [Fimbriiglobus sp.]
MFFSTETLLTWFVQTAVVGATILLVARLSLYATKNYLLRHKIGVWAMRATALVPLLTLLPSWWSVPNPLPTTTGPAARQLVAAPNEMALAAFEMPDTLVPAIVSDTPIFEIDPETETMFDEAEPPPLPPVAMEGSRRGADVLKVPVVAPVMEPNAVGNWVQDHDLTDASVLGLLGYGIISLYFLSIFVMGLIGLRKLRSTGKPASGRVLSILDPLTQDFRRKPWAMSSETVPSPVCFGVFRPTILLPKPLASLATADELKWVLAHEVDHLRRGDPLTGCIMAWVKACYFYVPWFWSLKREMLLGQEYLADAAAIAAGGKPIDYATFLVNLSQGTTSPTGRGALPAHGVRAGRSDLYRRVNMVLSNETPAARRNARRWSLLAGTGLLAAAVCLSGVSFATADDKKPEGDKPKAEVRDGVKEKAGKPDGDKPKTGERDTGKPRITERRDIRETADPAQTEEIKALKAKIAEAAKKGDTETVMKLVDQLTAKSNSPRVMVIETDGVPPIPPIPPRAAGGFPVPPVAPAAPGAPNVAFAPFPAMNFPAMSADVSEKLLKALNEAKEKVKGNEEAIKAIEAAIDEAKARAKEAQARAKEMQARIFETPLNPGAGQRMEIRPAVGPNGTQVFEYFPAPNAVGGKAWSTVRGGSFLGISVAPIDETLAEQLDLPKNVVVITNVVEKSPAAVAGLKKNDIVVTVNGESSQVLKNPATAVGMMATLKPGSEFKVEVVRKSKKETVTLKIPEAPATDRLAAGGSRAMTLTTPKVKFDSLAIQINDEKFEAKAKKGDTAYTVSGVIKDGQKTDMRILIKSADKSFETTGKNLSEIPAEHQTAIKSLLNSIGN